jgi:hypothetical protein
MLRTDPAHVIQADVAREYVMTLLEVDRPRHAEPVARAACDAKPTDAGLVANLALVLLLAGKIEDASATIERARDDDVPTYRVRRRVGRGSLPRMVRQWRIVFSTGACLQPSEAPG